LKEESGQHDVHPHLEEFAFPVLEGRLIEVASQQVATERDRLLTVLELLGVVDPDARQHHSAKEDHEKSQVGDQQSMITQPFAHRASSLILAT
jgi:hypothetical protein